MKVWKREYFFKCHDKFLKVVGSALAVHLQDVKGWHTSRTPGHPPADPGIATRKQGRSSRSHSLEDFLIKGKYYQEQDDIYNQIIKDIKTIPAMLNLVMFLLVLKAPSWILVISLSNNISSSSPDRSARQTADNS